MLRFFEVAVAATGDQPGRPVAVPSRASLTSRRPRAIVVAEMVIAGPDAKTVAAALYAECRLVSEFIAKDVRMWLLAEGVPSGADAVVLSQFLRIDAWLRTLKKCDEPGDFQAVVLATRALLEATIDLVLLTSNKIINAQLILDWEDSAKLKNAIALTAYYAKQNAQPQPGDEHAIIMEFGTRRRRSA